MREFNNYFGFGNPTDLHRHLTLQGYKVSYRAVCAWGGGEVVPTATSCKIVAEALDLSIYEISDWVMAFSK